jgi:hypothetical protein
VSSYSFAALFIFGVIAPLAISLQQLIQVTLRLL